jgi:hypothetical protein
MDVVTLFSIVVFAVSWFNHHRTPANEPLVRLFHGTMMGLGALVGLLGMVLRLMTP